jgi:hypothetical protein
MTTSNNKADTNRGPAGQQTTQAAEPPLAQRELYDKHFTWALPGSTTPNAA